MVTTIKIRRRARNGKPYGSFVADVLYPDGRKEELTTGVKPPATRADALSWVQSTLASRAGASGFFPPDAPASPLPDVSAAGSAWTSAPDVPVQVSEPAALSPAEDALAKARAAWGTPPPATPSALPDSTKNTTAQPTNPTANTERMRMVAGVVARWMAKAIFKLQDKLFVWMRRVSPSADPDEIKLVEWGLGEWAGKLFGSRELTPGVAILLGLGLSTVGRFMSSKKLPPLPAKKTPELASEERISAARPPESESVPTGDADLPQEPFDASGLVDLVAA